MEYNSIFISYWLQSCMPIPIPFAKNKTPGADLEGAQPACAPLFALICKTKQKNHLRPTPSKHGISCELSVRLTRITLCVAHTVSFNMRSQNYFLVY